MLGAIIFTFLPHHRRFLGQFCFFHLFQHESDAIPVQSSIDFKQKDQNPKDAKQIPHPAGFNFLFWLSRLLYFQIGL
jgi:hypothetical protein